jgi:hypothetical protein
VTHRPGTGADPAGQRVGDQSAGAREGEAAIHDDLSD